MLGRVGHLLSQQLPQNTSIKSIFKLPVAAVSNPIGTLALLKKLKCITSSLHANQLLAMRSSVTTFPPSRRHEDTTHLWQSNVSTLSLCIAWVADPIITHTGVYAAGEKRARTFQSLEASWNEKFLTYRILLKTGKLFYLGHLNPSMCSLRIVV